MVNKVRSITRHTFTWYLINTFFWSATLTVLPPRPAQAAALALSEVPLFVSTAKQANVLVVLDNSNSMDEAATGEAVGSASPDSKSEIARGVVKDLVATYTGKINMGLMAYQQSNIVSNYLHNSPYDVSYNPANYDPTFTGARDSLTKKYRILNPTSSGGYVHYNVALPFYSGSNQGTAFCYSPTAKAFNNGESPSSGPWDNYRCFGTKTGTNDGVVSPLPSGAIKASETALGYGSYKFTSQFFPTDSDLAQGILDFGKLNMWTYVGKTWFANSSPGRGYLHVPIASLDATQATKLNNKLATSQFTTATDTPIRNAGLTPIEGTLLTCKDYFAGNLSSTSEGGPQAAPPDSCGKNFVVLVTDGLPSTDKNGNTVTDPAAAIAAAAAAAGELKAAGVETYVIGFALPYGTDPTTLDQIAAAGGTGTAYIAGDRATLTAELNVVFSDILAKTGSAASVALSSTSFNSGSRLYQSKFNSADWSGQLLAYPINSNGSLAAQAWDAGEELNKQDYDTGRAIISYSAGLGIPFRWANLDAAQQTALNKNAGGTDDGQGVARLDYLRGRSTNEGTGSGQFRIRAGKLGDVINSAPYYVAKPAFKYKDTLESASYSAFETTYKDRTPMIYVGANDGMLHGFRAADGRELIAYVPGKVYSKLSQLTSQTYSHRYFVDGSPTVGDAFYGSAWHTVLVGGLRGGGQGVYALDVTDPNAFSEAGAANLVRWEFTDADDADLGYTFSQPSIVKMANGKWAAVFGNGYNNTEADGAASTTGRAVLYIVDIQTGALIQKIDTKAGSTTTPNGLATPAPVDTNGDRVTDYIYAGDLQGNMWKFDVSGSNPNQWKSAYGSGANPAPLFTAKDASGAAQPITTRPEVGKHKDGGYMVYFGTGKYIEVGDNVPTGAQTQSFYGIRDNNARLTGRSSLKQRTVQVVTAAGSYEYRVTSNDAIDWSTQRGWYLDLPEQGEKQVSDSILTNGRIIFTTLTPSTDACSGGGTSWLMELDALSGGRLTYSPFDVNGDGVFDTKDYVTVTEGGASVTVVTSGKRDKDVGILPSPAIQQTDDPNKERKYMSGSTGKISITDENTGGSDRGRISWREL